MYQLVGKRTLDCLLAFTGLLLSWPLLLIIGLCLFITDWSNPFFVQPRPGQFGRVFPLLKFKTMTSERGTDGQLLPDADRKTPLGNWLRRTSLDELPQLLNVLMGDMSLVGPRPLLVAYWPLYSAEQRRRHDVRPGITGWAQVNGRNALTWDEKFALDSWYAVNQSLAFDLKILWRTALMLVEPERTRVETALIAPFTGTQRV